jgi:hypothetical protein
MRTCEIDDCHYPVWGTDKNTGIGYCKRHQYERTDKKKPHGIKIKVPQVRDFSKVPDFGFENQQDMFAWLWQEAKDSRGIVTCPYTKERLNRFYGTNMWYSCFAHILPKGRYTYWKLNPKNVVVVHPDFHAIVDQGTSLDRINHPLWKFDLWDKRKLEMKIEYDVFKKQNLLG